MERIRKFHLISGRLGTLVLAAALLVNIFPSFSVCAASAAPEGMRLVTENDALALYIDEEETDVAVVDKAGGTIWYTNPPQASEDAGATAYYQRVLKSQLQIQYYNDNVQSGTMDNYNDSIMDGQFTIEYLEDGVTVTYTLGDMGTSSLLLPDAISLENMDKWTEAMSEDAVRKVNRNYTLVDPYNLTGTTSDYMDTYPGFGTKQFYVLRSGVKDYLREELAGYFEEAGYTRSDYEADLLESGAGEKEIDVPWFTVPLTYRLTEDSLVVSLNPAEVTYNDDGYYLVDIDLLPYFGAQSGDDGYLFVPDGSGALIYFNNGKYTSSSYSAVVYGTDVSTQVLSGSRSEIDQSLTVKMPVFGIKAGDSAMFAVIEDGAGYANIAADVAGRTSSYNNVYAGFSYLQYGSASLSEMVGANSYQLYGEADFTGIYQVRYFFLNGDEADYSGMAALYRNYLEEKGILTRNTDETEFPFYAEFIGAVNKYKTILGVKYNAVETLTTYAQAEEILTELELLGVGKPSVIYSGWMNGGLHGTAAVRVSPVSGLEAGGVSLKQFQQDMQNAGVGVYMTVDMQYVYQDKLLDGYSTLQYGPDYFDHSDVKVYSYVLADGTVDGKLADLISPYYAGKVTGVLSKAVQKYGITGINLGTASNYLYSDFLESRYTDRQKAIELYRESFSALQEQTGAFLGDNSNLYSIQYTEDIINVPFFSNGYQILDEDVPFYEMVLHGYVRYAGEALNMADDYTTVFLKSIECGAGLYYQWIYEDNSVLKETEFDSLYSVNYETWIETAAQDYKELASALAGLENRLIIKHEIVAENVSRTTYEDGTEVYVNYNRQDAAVGNVTVPARGYTVRKGSE